MGCSWLLEEIDTGEVFLHPLKKGFRDVAVIVGEMHGSCCSGD